MKIKAATEGKAAAEFRLVFWRQILVGKLTSKIVRERDRYIGSSRID